MPACYIRVMVCPLRQVGKLNGIIAGLVIFLSGCEESTTRLSHIGEFEANALDSYFDFSSGSDSLLYCYIFGSQYENLRKKSRIKLPDGRKCPKGVFIVFNGEIVDINPQISSRENLIISMLPRTRVMKGKLNVYRVSGSMPELPNGHVLDQ